jgi:hypothetical protein
MNSKKLNEAQGPMKHMLTRDGFVVKGPITVHVWRKEQGDNDPYLEKIEIDLPMIFPYLGGPEWCICRPGQWATLLDTTFASELVAYQVMKAECEQMRTGSSELKALVARRIEELSKSSVEAAPSIAITNAPPRPVGR